MMVVVVPLFTSSRTTPYFRAVATCWFNNRPSPTAYLSLSNGRTWNNKNWQDILSISKKNGHRFPCTLLFWRRRKQNTEKVHIIQKVFKQLIYIPLHILELCPYLPVLPVFVSNAASNSYCPYCPYCPYLPVFVSNAAHLIVHRYLRVKQLWEVQMLVVVVKLFTSCRTTPHFRALPVFARIARICPYLCQMLLPTRIARIARIARICPYLCQMLLPTRAGSC